MRNWSRSTAGYLAAIQCTLARLCARGKVELRRDGNLLEDQALEHVCCATRMVSTMSCWTPRFTSRRAQVRRLKEFYADFFDWAAARQ